MLSGGTTIFAGVGEYLTKEAARFMFETFNVPVMRCVPDRALTLRLWPYNGYYQERW